MRRHFRWDKKYWFWGMTAFAVIAAAILFYMALSYLPALGNALKKLSRILSPFIWGLVFTYLLTPLMRSMEKHLFYPLGKKLYRKNPVGAKRFGRVLSVLLSIIVLLAVLTALVYMILPQIYSSIETIITNSPVYLENLNNWFDKVLTDFPALHSLSKKPRRVFRSQAKNQSNLVFSGGVYVGENTSQLRSVRVVRPQRTASARTELHPPPSRKSIGLF